MAKNQTSSLVGRKILGISLPARMKIDSLKPSINRAFINTTVPEIKPTVIQLAAWRALLGIDPNVITGTECVYCGQAATQFDHFRNLTENGRPTGYITDIFNLVPCCSTCNGSKRGENWRSWMTGPVRQSPRQRLMPSDLAARVAVLDRFESWSTPLATKLNVLAIVGQQEWEQYEADITTICTLLQAARQRSDLFHSLLQQAYIEQRAAAQSTASL